MLGYLNEHLQLKRQALDAYQRLDVVDVVAGYLRWSTIEYISLFFSRAVELLQSMFSKEELAFALGSYGRALW